MQTSTQKVRTLDCGQLKSLLIEIRQIGNQEAPAKFKQSALMKELFSLVGGHYWLDKYRAVIAAIEHEILERVYNGNWV